MVDFNNETTIGVPATDVERITILQRRHDLIEAYEAYKKMGSRAPFSMVRVRLTSLFMEIQATLERRFAKREAEYTAIKEACLNSSLEEENFLNVFFTINKELDIIRLTRVDLNKVYNEMSVEEENKEKGY